MMKKFCITLCVFFFALPNASAADIKTSEVAYHGEVMGYFAEPIFAVTKPVGPRPAVILIHEWWGLNDDIRMRARNFAENGYAALAVDLYQGESTATPEKARELAGQVRADLPAAFANLNAAIAFLKSRESVDATRLASIGWCFGGGWSYQIAKNNLGAKASVIYYGRFNPADDLQKMRAKILGHFGETDRAIAADNVREFQATLKTLSGEHEIYIYPNAGHGFANPDNSSYSKEAANLAHIRTLEFLQNHL